MSFGDKAWRVVHTGLGACVAKKMIWCERCHGQMRVISLNITNDHLNVYLYGNDERSAAKIKGTHTPRGDAVGVPRRASLRF
jgi:hypothetical protein